MKQNKKKKNDRGCASEVDSQPGSTAFQHSEKSYRKSERDTDLLASHKIGLCSEEQVRH